MNTETPGAPLRVEGLKFVHPLTQRDSCPIPPSSHWDA